MSTWSRPSRSSESSRPARMPAGLKSHERRSRAGTTKPSGSPAAPSQSGSSRSRRPTFVDTTNSERGLVARNRPSLRSERPSP